MSFPLRLSALVLAVSLGATSLACTATTEAPAAPAEPVSSEEDFTSAKGYDIPKSEELLKKAVAMAEKNAAGLACDEDAYRSNIVGLLREAVAVRNTVFFRTKVIAKKEVLARVLAGTLEWQEILGKYDPKNPATLGAALATGVSIWDTNGGAFGNQRRIQFAEGGKAVIHVLDTESADFRWNATPTTWKLVGDKLTLGTGATFTVRHDGDILFVTATAQGVGSSNFISEQSECSA